MDRQSLVRHQILTDIHRCVQSVRDTEWARPFYSELVLLAYTTYILIQNLQCRSRYPERLARYRADERAQPAVGVRPGRLSNFAVTLLLTSERVQ